MKLQKRMTKANVFGVSVYWITLCFNLLYVFRSKQDNRPFSSPGVYESSYIKPYSRASIDQQAKQYPYPNTSASY